MEDDVQIIDCPVPKITNSVPGITATYIVYLLSLERVAAVHKVTKRVTTVKLPHAMPATVILLINVLDYRRDVVCINGEVELDFAARTVGVLEAPLPPSKETRIQRGKYTYVLGDDVKEQEAIMDSHPDRVYAMSMSANLAGDTTQTQYVFYYSRLFPLLRAIDCFAVLQFQRGEWGMSPLIALPRAVGWGGVGVSKLGEVAYYSTDSLIYCPRGLPLESFVPRVSLNVLQGILSLWRVKTLRAFLMARYTPQTMPADMGELNDFALLNLKSGTVLEVDDRIEVPDGVPAPFCLLRYATPNDICQP